MPFASATAFTFSVGERVDVDHVEPSGPTAIFSM